MMPGRLADLVFLGSQDKTSRQTAPHTAAPSAVINGEIQPLPVQVGRIPRHDHRHSVCPSVPHRDPNTEIPLLSKLVSIPIEPPSPTVAGVIGTHVIVGETGTLREAQDALPPVASQIQLVHQEPPPTPSGTPVPAGEQGHLLVDDEETPPRGDALPGTPPFPHRAPPILGRVSVRVGSPPPQSITVGLWSHQETSLHIKVLEMKALFLALQTFLDTVANQHVTAMCDNSTVVAYVSKRRGGGGGGDSLRLPLRVDRAASPLGGSPQLTPGSEIPPGTIQRPRGSPQPPQSGTSGGMVPTPTGS